MQSKFFVYVVAGIVLILGGVVYLGYRGDLRIPFVGPNPDAVLRESVSALAGVTAASVTYSGEVTIPPNDTVIVVHGSGNGTRGDRGDERRSTGSMTLQYVQAGTTIELSLTQRQLGETTYVRVDQLPTIPGISDALEISSLSNQWIRFTVQDLYESPLFGGIVPSTEQQTAQRDILDMIGPLLAEASPLVRTDPVAAERIGELPTYRFAFRFDKDRLLAFAQRLIAQGAAPAQEYSSSVLNESYPKLWDAVLQHTRISIWIGQRDALPYRVHLAGSVGASNENAGMDATYDVTVTVDSYNEPVQVAPPEDSRSFSEVLALVLGDETSEYLQSEEFRTGIRTDSDGDGLVDILEEAYGTDPAVADTDGDGYADGEEVTSGFNPLGDGTLTGSAAEQNFIDAFEELTGTSQPGATAEDYLELFPSSPVN